MTARRKVNGFGMMGPLQLTDIGKEENRTIQIMRTVQVYGPRVDGTTKNAVINTATSARKARKLRKRI